MVTISNTDLGRIIKALIAYVDTPHDGSTREINARRIAKVTLNKLQRIKPSRPTK